MTSGPLQDLHGRIFETLRVSVTDRCNFRCHYCMPAEGMEWFPREDILSYEEIRRVVEAAAELGLKRVRLTGGEPLLRVDLDQLVEILGQIVSLEEINLTTNGVLLPKFGPALRDAGLTRVNVSLDSLNQETFQKMARRDLLGQVLKGLDAASELFPQVKLNVVLLKGSNDHEIVDFARFARERDIEVRFIEFMPLDAGSSWRESTIVTGQEVHDRIHEVFPLVPKVTEHMAQPSSDFVFADGAPGGIGLINSMTEAFCGRCDRMRLTSDGKLLNCMFDRGELDVRDLLRADGSKEEIQSILRASAKAKGPGGLLEIHDAGYYKGMRNMSRLGG